MTTRTATRFPLSQFRWTVSSGVRKAVFGIPRLLRILAPVLAWAAISISLGLVVGFAAIILPPTGAFGIVAGAALFLLWVTPDLPALPLKLVRPAFLTMLIVDLCVPIYYTIIIQGLPWISARRLVSFVFILLFALVMAASSTERARVATALRDAKALSICTFGFALMIILSIFTSINPAGSLSSLTDALLTWYVPLLAVIYVIRTEEDVVLALRIIGWSSIFIAVMAAVEFKTGRNLFVEVLPRSIVAAIAEGNPGFEAMMDAGSYRNGIPRVNSLFMTVLSLGEFQAMTAPIGYFFLVHGAKIRDRVFGAAIAVTSLVGVFCSGSRGGYVCFIAGTVAFVTLSVIRKGRFDLRSLVPGIAGLSAASGFAVLLALILFWTRLHNMVLGGGDAAASNDGRNMQWTLAIPKIWANPFTGHGFSMGGEVVGFYTASAISSVDSYVISLLVESGVPSLVFFAGMVLIGIWFGVRRYLASPTLQGAIAGSLACCLLSFGIYRIYLSQRESHTLFYVIVGLVIWLTNSEKRQGLATKPLRPPVG